MKHDRRISPCPGRHPFAGMLALWLMLALIAGTACPSLRPAVAETSDEATWNARVAQWNARYETPPDYDGSLWMKFNGASKAEYYNMLVRKSEDAVLDLFIRSGTYVGLDDGYIGQRFYRYKDYEPFSDILVGVPQYALFDEQSWYRRPITDSKQMLLVFVTQYCYTNPKGASVLEQGFSEFVDPLMSAEVRLVDCELYDWMTDGYKQEYVDTLIYTETEDYYLFEITPDDGTKPYQLLFRDYAYYDAWRPMANREALTGEPVRLDINSLLDISYGGILTSQVDMMVIGKDETPLSMDVELVNPRKDGGIDAIVTVDFDRGDAAHPIEKVTNVRLSLDGTNGYTPREKTVDLGTLTEYEVVQVHFDYADPDGLLHPSSENPTVMLHLTADNCPPVDYSRRIDVQPRARVLSLYRGGPDAQDEVFARASATIVDIYSGRTYDGVEVICEDERVGRLGKDGQCHDGCYIDDPEALGMLQAFETDDNDITFIYIVTHGVNDRETKVIQPNLSMCQSNNTNITHQELLAYIEDHVKGRVVLMEDLCYSGQAIDAAQALSLDPDRYFIVTGTTRDYAQTVAYGDTDIMEVSFLVRRAFEENPNSASCGILYELVKKPVEVLGVIGTTVMNAVGNGIEFALLSENDKARYVIRKLFPEERVAKDDVAKLAREYLEHTIAEEQEVDSIMDLFKTKTLTPSIQDLMRKLNYEDKNLEERVSEIMWEGIRTAWGVNKPQFYGNPDLPLVFGDPDFDDHYRLPVPLEEDEANAAS